jgi:hypothetical protein
VRHRAETEEALRFVALRCRQARDDLLRDECVAFLN